MLRGTSKRVIVLKHCKGDVFDEAYFIVKNSENGKKRDTKSLICEARKIINGEKKEDEKAKEKKVFFTRLTNLFFFILGILFAILIFDILSKV